jgi:HK97 gp10 family phage protein
VARFKVSPNLEKYEKKLSKLGDKARPMIEKAVKEGANPVADAVRAGLNGIPVDDGYRKKGEIRSGLRSVQKAGLSASLGVAPIRNDGGFINVKVGFDGYNNMHTKQYPNGQPNAMIARSIESGTSIMQAHPFVGPAVSKSRKQAEKIMEQSIDKSISEIMN